MFSYGHSEIKEIIEDSECKSGKDKYSINFEAFQIYSKAQLSMDLFSNNFKVKHNQVQCFEYDLGYRRKEMKIV